MNTPMHAAGSVRRGLPAWAWILISLGFLLVLAGGFGVARLLGSGMDAFQDDALVAMRGDPVITEHIGEIRSARIDLMRSGTLPGANAFAFRLEGTRGAGVVEADFVTTLDGERLGKGSLRMDDGKTHRLPGQILTPGVN